MSDSSGGHKKEWYNVDLSDPAVAAALVGLSAAAGAGVKYLADEYLSGRLKIPPINWPQPQQQQPPQQQPPAQSNTSMAPAQAPAEEEEKPSFPSMRFSTLGGDKAKVDRANTLRIGLIPTAPAAAKPAASSPDSPFGKKVRTMSK